MLFPGEAVGFTTYAHCFIPVQSISGDLSKLQSLISRILLVGDHYPKEVGHTRISETTKTNLTCLTCFLSGDLWTPKHPLPTKVLRLRAHTHNIYSIYIYMYIHFFTLIIHAIIIYLYDMPHPLLVMNSPFLPVDPSETTNGTNAPSSRRHVALDGQQLGQFRPNPT